MWHLAADGECTWADFAEAIFEEAGLDCRVRRITTAELGRPAPRPAYSVLRSERPGAPKLPHWRDGLRACLDRLRLSCCALNRWVAELRPDEERGLARPPYSICWGCS